MTDQLTIYEEVTKITEDYFGPVAPRLINRIVTSHLHKKPNQVTRKDLSELVDWIILATAVVTEDTEVINEFTLRLSTLLPMNYRSTSISNQLNR